jgi:hypothetical protein
MNIPPVPQNDMATMVRNYVHYDNLANNYSKQASGARKLRDEFESKIITNLRANNMENAIIQISGGARLQCTEEKTPPSLTLPRLESYLQKYFAQKTSGLNETEAILRFIRLQKQQETQVNACLKRISSPTPIPGPPPPGQMGLK